MRAEITYKLFCLTLSFKMLQTLMILNAFFVQLQKASTMNMSRHCEQRLKDISNLSTSIFITLI